MEKTGTRPTVRPSLPTTLKAVGREEHWLQDRVALDPVRLGLGQITIKVKELGQYGGKGVSVARVEHAIHSKMVEVLEQAYARF